jgi:hypothetical protein
LAQFDWADFPLELAECPHLHAPVLQQQHLGHLTIVLKSDEKAKHELSIKDDCNKTTHTITQSFLIMYKDSSP